MTKENKDLKIKLALLQVGKELGNVSKACRLLGYSRDSFYRIRDLYEKGGEAALKPKPRTVPNIKNRSITEVENQVMQLTFVQPRWGQVRIARQLRRRGTKISPSGVRCIWMRHGMETIEKRLKVLESEIAVDAFSEAGVCQPADAGNRSLG